MENTTKNISQLLRNRIEKAKAEGRMKPDASLRNNDELLKKLKAAKEKAITEGRIKPMQLFGKTKLTEIIQRMKAAKEGK